jgi:hypothetical protein
VVASVNSSRWVARKTTLISQSQVVRDKYEEIPWRQTV